MHQQGLAFTVALVRQRLVKARQLAHLSQGEAAQHLGVSRPTVSYLESGKQELTVAYLLQLAELYCVPVVALVGDGTWKDANGFRYSLNPGERACRDDKGFPLPYLLCPKK